MDQNVGRAKATKKKRQSAAEESKTLLASTATSDHAKTPFGQR